MIEPFSTSISVLALATSAATVWLTFFRRGRIQMTQPTTIFFGPDGTGRVSPKVYLRTLLFSTAKRGGVIESMYIALSRNESRQNFPIWVYGNDSLARGSGLFVGEDGIVTNHHFLTLRDEEGFQFVAGTYRLKLFARVLRESADTLLFEQELEITPAHAAELARGNAGIYFDWGPETCRYLAHVNRKEPGPGPGDLIDIMKALREGAGRE
jgi:hypothetical protein